MANSKFSFLSWVRQGVSKGIANVDGDLINAPAIRPEIQVDFDLIADPVNSGGAVYTGNKQKSILLFGPGDITGLDAKSIVRTIPLNNSTSFEYNLLPNVEFFDEDFPWRYTPAKASGSADSSKLTPWIALIVLKEDEFTKNAFNGIQHSISTIGSIADTLPNPNELWAWAHVHVNADLGEQISTGIDDLTELLDADSSKAISRIICPRKLEENTQYHGFLVPVFELGRKAGLGLEADPSDNALTYSWDIASQQGVTLPIYHEWTFKTSDQGDFKTLVNRIGPIVYSTEEMGGQEMDIQNPGPLNFVGLADSPTMMLEGIIKPVAGQGYESNWAINDLNNSYQEELKDLLNSQFDNTSVPEQNPDPLISAPLYGRWHAQKRELDDVSQDWYHEINLDPRLRAFAGLGSEVVKQNQEEFMAICWEQVKDIEEANQKIRIAQLSEVSSGSLYARTINSQTDENLLVLASSVQSRVKDLNSTLYGAINSSSVPNALLTGAFRRIGRPNGFLSRNFSNQSSTLNVSTLLSDINEGNLSASPVYNTPQGINQISFDVLQNFNSSWVSSQPARDNFYATIPGVYNSPGSGSLDSLSGYNFRSATSNAVNIFGLNYSTPVVPQGINISNWASTVLTEIAPETTILSLVNGRISIVDFTGNLITLNELNQIMASPTIEIPMSKYLNKISPDFIMPQVSQFKNDKVALFQLNQKYVEAFMLGLNHEMMGELLWREYPTDQRGTVFSVFWNTPGVLVDSQSNTEFRRAIKPIHLWKNGSGLTQLGVNHASGNAPSEWTILGVRAELLNKYPSTYMYMHEAEWTLDGQSNIDFRASRSLKSGNGEEQKSPKFMMSIGDIKFFGFDISVDQIKGSQYGLTPSPGWFICFKEAAGELNFGINTEDLHITPMINWNQLDWSYFNGSFIEIGAVDSIDPQNPNELTWGTNSSNIAGILRRNPMKVFIHGDRLTV